jgi:hypothetical protein
MQIGVIGSGRIGRTAAELFVDVGHEVMIANSRGPASLSDVVADLGEGASAATVEEAAAFGDLVLEAIPFGAYRDLPAEQLGGTIVVSASNYYPDRDGEIDFGGRTQTELVAEHLADSRVVKAFNTMFWETLRDDGRPDADREDRLVLFVAGDDDDAKAVVSDLIEQIGFTAVDTGSLAAGGRRQQPGTLIYNEPMTPAEARAKLAAMDE